MVLEPAYPPKRVKVRSFKTGLAVRIITFTKYTFKGLGASVSEVYSPDHSSRQVFAAMFAYLKGKTERTEATFQSSKFGSWYVFKMLQKKYPHVDLLRPPLFDFVWAFESAGIG